MPTIGSNAASGAAGGMGGGSSPGIGMGGGGGSGITSGLLSLLENLMGIDRSSPAQAAGREYSNYGNQATGVQNPFYNTGTGAIPKYEDWLNSQKDPAKFINDTMGKYNESEWAKNQQNIANRAGQNAASASGLIGSTPYMQAAQQIAGQISSADQDTWLRHVLGINTQYGQGQKGLIDTGQGAANQLSAIYNLLGGRMGEAKFGEEAAKNQQGSDLLSSIVKIFSSITGLG